MLPSRRLNSPKHKIARPTATEWSEQRSGVTTSSHGLLTCSPHVLSHVTRMPGCCRPSNEDPVNSSTLACVHRTPTRSQLTNEITVHHEIRMRSPLRVERNKDCENYVFFYSYLTLSIKLLPSFIYMRIDLCLVNYLTCPCHTYILYLIKQVGSGNQKRLCFTIF